MVMDEGQPTLLGIGRVHRAVAQVLPHGTGRYSNPELQFQLIGDALLAPDRVVRSHLSDQLPEVLGQARPSRWFGLPAPEQPKSFALPSDERIRLYIHQRIAPREHSAQGGHYPSGGVVGPSWFDLPLLEQCQLLAKEEILRRQGTAGMHREGSESDQVDDHQRQRPEAVGNGTEKPVSAT